MILPGTTYKTNKDLKVQGTIHFKKSYSEGFEFNLPKGSQFKISYWAEPEDRTIQVWPMRPERFSNQIVSKAILDSPFYDAYSFSIYRSDIEVNSTLSYDFSSAIYFYSPHEPFGEFSNFSALWINYEGKYFPTLEHYFQAQKFLDHDYSEKIRKAKTPKEASILGNSRAFKIQEDWDLIRDDIMFNGIKNKFETHPQLGELLLSTGDTLLIENSPYDYYWGIGKTGNGLNKLGTILMRTRVFLQKKIPHN